MELVVFLIPTAGPLGASAGCLPQVSKPIRNLSDIPEDKNVTIFSK
jgi:hypothetical protein